MTDTEYESCYVCGDRIERDDWVIPLETFRAYYYGGEFSLNADETCETVIHADCLGGEREDTNE